MQQGDEVGLVGWALAVGCLIMVVGIDLSRSQSVITDISVVDFENAIKFTKSPSRKHQPRVSTLLVHELWSIISNFFALL